MSGPFSLAIMVVKINGGDLTVSLEGCLPAAVLPVGCGWQQSLPRGGRKEGRPAAWSSVITFSINISRLQGRAQGPSCVWLVTWPVHGKGETCPGLSWPQSPTIPLCMVQDVAGRV